MNIRRRPPNPSIKVSSLEYAIPHSEGDPQNILEKIIWEKSSEVDLARERFPLEDLKSKVSKSSGTRSFINALKNPPVTPAVIAEIKKASPSKGVIRQDFDPIEIAKAYQEGGASCLSVLTDKKFFQGGFEVLTEVRKVVDLPLLCKDFIISPYQLYQARLAGADAVLFIASILSDQDMHYLKKVADFLSLDVLVEVHDAFEMERIISLDIFTLIGINNRDLKTFNIDLSTTEKLACKYLDQLTVQKIFLVSESGLFTRADLDQVYSAGAGAVLVGEALMRQIDIKKGLIKLIEG